MGFYNIINSLFKNIFATLKIIRKLFFMIIFVVIVVVLLNNTCFAANSQTIQITNFQQGSINGSGNDDINTARIRTDFINLPEGDYTLSYSGAEQAGVYLYNLNGSFNKLLFSWTSGDIYFHLDGNFLVRFTFKYSNNANITPSDISNVYLLFENHDPNIDYTESLDIINSNISNGFNVISNDLLNSNVNLNNNLPTIEIQDITQAGFGGIFTKIRDAFTMHDPGASYTFTIPFVDKPFTLSMDSVYGGFDLQPIKSILIPFWWFVVSLYIVKDIAKQLNKLKSGNVDNVANENVKEDLL